MVHLPHNPQAMEYAIAGLARAIALFAPSDGDHGTAIPSLSLHRRREPTQPLHCIFSLGLGVVVQGHKQVLLGDHVMTYGPGQSMLTTIDLPVVAHVTRADVREPMLGMMVTLDPSMVLEIAADVHRTPPPRLSGFQPISIEALDVGMIGALTRLVELLREPALLPQVAPLIQREIIVRLLAGPHAPQLLHLVATGSPSQQVAKSVAWIKKNFAKPLSVDELAASVHMSASTFRQHFRTITGTSPVQFQKQMRLQEARQLMLNQSLDAAEASGQVGYESPSQFSREYSRLFGAPPLQDVRRMRQT